MMSGSHFAGRSVGTRVFQIDVSVCRRCGGPMRVIKAVLDPDEIAAELHGARAPPRPPPPGQVELFAG